MRPDISSAKGPEYWKVTAMTGMPMSGKMSVAMPARPGDPEQGQCAKQWQQQREDDEGVGAAQGHLDDPHSEDLGRA